MPNNTSFFKRLWQSKVFRWILGFLVLVILIIIWVVRNNSKNAYQFVTVARGSITQSVSLTGNTTPTNSVSLTFGSTGTISNVYTNLGKQVRAGELLAELNTADLVAQLRQAQANVAVQKAKLDSLQSGSRPEDIAGSQATLDKAKQDLTNMYLSISDVLTDGYTKGNDAVRTQLDPFFINGETTNPNLSYTINNNSAKYSSENGRISASLTLNKIQDLLNNLKVSNSNNNLEVALQNETDYLSSLRDFVSIVSSTLSYTPSLSTTNLALYKMNVSTGLGEINLAIKNINTLEQNIASQKLIVLQLQAALDLKRAPALPSDISAQEAQVNQAQASVESANAKLQNAQIIAPFSGTITQLDAKVGQIASPSVPLISIMSSGGYEVDAGVSEIDVGKISSGNKVSMTLDAFPNETLTGSVFYIAPAETNINGVISYKTKISFDKIDPRLKSGLTANIDIQTKHKDNILFLPEYAILQNDQGTFVEVLVNNKVQQKSVVLGIADQKGNVEVVSGVTEGEKVLNIGLKS